MAVVGAGEHGQRHARLFREMLGAELVGIYDLRPDRRERVAADLGVRAFPSLPAALAAAQAVTIVIPTTQHAAVARQALVNGVDVLLEKPVARTLEEADELIRISAERGRILQVGHVERFNAGVTAAKPITHHPLFFEVHRLGVFSPRSLDVDVVFDLMIHDLDLILWLVDQRVGDVRAVGLPVLSDKVDIANARVEFENGAVANVTASRVSTEKIRKFRYFQADQYVSIDFTRQDALVIRVSPGASPPRLEFRRLGGEPSEPLRAELESFVRSVVTRQAPLVGGREGREALALALRVMESIERHAAQVHVSLKQPSGQTGES